MISPSVAVLFAGLTLACACPSGTRPDAAQVARAEASQALLRRYVVAVEGVAKSGSVNPMREQLSELTTDAAESHTRNELSDEFYAGFSRLLEVTTAIFEPKPTPGVVAEANEQLAALAQSVGEREAVTIEDGLAGRIPLAREEVVRLHLVADPTATRVDAESRYFSMAGP